MKQKEPKITLIKNLYFVLHEQLHTTKQPRISGVIISKLVSLPYRIGIFLACSCLTFSKVMVSTPSFSTAVVSSSRTVTGSSSVRLNSPQ